MLFYVANFQLALIIAALYLWHERIQSHVSKAASWCINVDFAEPPAGDAVISSGGSPGELHREGGIAMRFVGAET
jgi:hypothetical protein